ncbi:MAG: DUF493 family protein [Victivallaceae bacterium]|nr:DUF493 family protein [Victivallaceae bacterium]
MKNVSASSNEELHFPVEWCYRIVVAAADDAVAARLGEVVEAFGKSAKWADGLTSSGGKYRTILCTVWFDSRQELEDLSERIAKVPGVKFAL